MSTQNFQFLCALGVVVLVVYQFAFLNTPKWAAATAVVSAGVWAVVHFTN